VHDDASNVSLRVTLAVLAAALFYTAGWVLRVPGEPRPSRWRLASFLLGLLVLWAALGSPISNLDHHRLSFHMLQHLLLMNLAAPLLLLGAPFAVFAREFPKAVSVLLGRARRSTAGRFFTHPGFTWLMATAVVVCWHVPRVFALTLASPSWHAVQHASFLVAGLLFWWPVVLPWPAVAVWPRWSLPLYLFLATLPCDVLSAFLAFSGRIVYPHYVVLHPDGGVAALADQAFAGALMWCVVTVAYLFPAVLITVELLSPKREHVRPVPAA
jgi:putative membrane protein